MIDELEQLSLTSSQVSMDEAKRVVDAANRKLIDALRADVVKLYWSSAAQDGVLLSPIAFINNTREPDPRAFQLMPRGPKGILSWVFEKKKQLWLDDLHVKDLKLSLTNEATGDAVDSEYVDMAPGGWLNGMIIVPLFARGDIRGLYSAELAAAGRLSRSNLDLLARIAKPLAAILWDAEVYEYRKGQTAQAVNQCLSSIASMSSEDLLRLTGPRSGFIARPFDPEFARVEQKIVSFLNSKRTEARAYQPQRGDSYVIEDVQHQVKLSHFCIADITGLSPNVMAEVGMMMVLKKPLLILRRRGEIPAIPFNIRHLNVYEYEFRPNLEIWDVTESKFEPVDVVLDQFTR